VRKLFGAKGIITNIGVDDDVLVSSIQNEPVVSKFSLCFENRGKESRSSAPP